MLSFQSFLAWVETHPGTASWVQGIGALVALGIAISLPLIDHYSKTKRNREIAFALASDSFGNVQLIVQLYRDIQNESDEVRKGISRTGLVLAEAAFLSVTSTLSALPKFEFGSASATLHLVDMEGHIALLKTSLFHFPEGPEVGIDDDDVLTLLADVRDRFQKFCRSINKQVPEHLQRHPLYSEGTPSA